MENKFDWRKYLIVFLITLGLFATASYLSSFFSNNKLNELKSIQDDIALNILSSETEFSLLSDLSCRNISGSILSDQLDELGTKLDWGQKNLGMTDEVLYLKKYYSLLQIKDYLLMKKVSTRCSNKSAFVLYFYTTLENCSECEKQGIVLSALRNKYPELRVYSFDYSTDLSALRSMLNIYKIKDTELPALVIDEDRYTGFRDMDELESVIKKSFSLTSTTPKGE